MNDELRAMHSHILALSKVDPKKFNELYTKYTGKEAEEDALAGG